MSLNDSFGDVETESNASSVVLVGLDVMLEDRGWLVGGDSAAGVANGKVHLITGAADSDDDVSVWRSADRPAAYARLSNPARNDRSRNPNGAIGKERVGVRLSPYGAASGMSPYPEVDAMYLRLADEFNKLGIAYLHIVDHSAMGAPPVPASIKKTIRERFKGAYIAARGFDRASARNALESKEADLIAFDCPFIANPDLVARLEQDTDLAIADMSKAYSPGPQGYTDYPMHGA